MNGARRSDWPLPETQWTKLYLNSWERLSAEPFVAVERRRDPAARRFRADAADADERRPEAALPDRSAAATTCWSPGRSRSTLFAAIDQDDTNWIVILKDVGPDVSVRTRARRRARSASRSAGTRGDPRLAQGVAPRASIRQALKALEALAPADARGAEAGHARRRSSEYADRDHGDREPVPARAPHLRRDHQPRSADRRRAAPPTSNTCPTTSAAARPCCTRSITIRSGPRIFCCPSSQVKCRRASVVVQRI